jgi:hypothetical protein
MPKGSKCLWHHDVLIAGIQSLMAQHRRHSADGEELLLVISGLRTRVFPAWCAVQIKSQKPLPAVRCAVAIIVLLQADFLPRQLCG